MAKPRTPVVDDRTVTKHELKQVERANASGKRPVVFVHGLWLLPTSWDRWVKHCEAAGYTAVVPGWPDDPETVDEAKSHPEVFARKSVGDIADHFEAVIRKLGQKPVVRSRSTRRTPTADRSLISRAKRTTPFPGPSPTLRTRRRSATPASPRSSR